MFVWGVRVFAYVCMSVIACMHVCMCACVCVCESSQVKSKFSLMMDH